MANTLTAIAPTLFSAAQQVSAEPFGAISAINANFDNKGVAIGDVVKVPVAPAGAAAPYTPSMNLNGGNAGTDAIAAEVDVTITANLVSTWHLTGEQEKSLMNGGNDREWFRQMVAQKMRVLRNAADAAACLAIKNGASRAIGTAGTTPFATSMDELVDIRGLLRANGMPFADAQGVLNGSAVINLQKLGTYQLAYAAGSDAERRSGLLGNQFGFKLRDSAGIVQHVKGTATGYNVNLAAGYLAGDTTIVVDGSDAGTILNGDVITWAGDANKYIVLSASASGAATGNIVLNRPGLRASLADTVVGTTGGSYTPNLFFERSAVVGIIRPPSIPANPSIEQMLVSDEYGLTYLVCRVVGDGLTTWRVHLAYGFKAVQPEHIAILLG